MKRLRIALYLLLGLATLLTAAIWASLQPLPATLGPDLSGARRLQVRDRTGAPLSVTYENDWNLHDTRGRTKSTVLIFKRLPAGEPVDPVVAVEALIFG